MTCRVLTDDVLEDIALGGPAEDDATTHLHGCAACTARLVRYRALVDRMDGAVEAIVRAQPRPDFGTQIAAEARRTPSSGTRALRWPAAAVGFALAASIAGLLVLPRGPHQLHPNTSIAALEHWHSPTAGL